MPLVAVNIEIESLEPDRTTEEIKMKAQELRDRARQKKEEEEKKLDREREKFSLECLTCSENSVIYFANFSFLASRVFSLLTTYYIFQRERIRAGKELFEAKRIAEDNERKRFIALKEAEKEEEKRARENVLQKLEADKLERRQKLGLPSENRAAVDRSIPVVQDKMNSLPVLHMTKLDHMRECLRHLRRNYKDEDARVKMAFQTLLIYVGNVVKNPNEEKFRKIRLSNPIIPDSLTLSFLINFEQQRVGSLEGGIEFLELCGFERIEGDNFLFLPRDKVDMAALNSAGSLIRSAITNPFFGLLSG
ncbi:hypothetical protein Patl1_01576 [Pistacia atlantica]|uniref:Uncharacterized protein n=1 Tax=Pistacia atlantica TaxID=434234 RepID=A0ACC1C548_9ROSI|nr:hypothetical protein Patl1_01576 [Pistacia atlantica]